MTGIKRRHRVTRKCQWVLRSSNEMTQPRCKWYVGLQMFDFSCVLRGSLAG